MPEIWSHDLSHMLVIGYDSTPSFTQVAHDLAPEIRKIGEEQARQRLAVEASRRVSLPTAELISDGLPAEALCTICLDGPLDASHKWTWLACSRCRCLDRVVARVLGGSRHFLPLGRHSIMNGAGVHLDAPPLAARAGQEQRWRMASTWGDLQAWKRSELRRTALANGWPEQGVISWSDWSSRTACSDSYVRYLREHHPWLADIDGRLLDATALSAVGGRLSPGAVL